MSGLQVRVPVRGGFNPPVGGGGDDPRRPHRHKPGRAHQKEASQSAASKAYKAYKRSLRARRRKRDEHEALSTGLPIK